MAGNNDVVSIRVPYRNLKDAEVEMTGIDDGAHHQIDLNSSATSPSSSFSKGNGGGGGCGDQSPLTSESVVAPNQNTLMTLILSCTVAAGVQFGWALQLSLLTPYIQTLGIGHAFSSFIWLCGPITGLVVQPCVGIWSDKCTLKMGRRRPFILAGSLMISVAGPARALLADLSGPDQRNTANAVFCSWMAVGNILGFSAGASGNWHRWFPFLLSRSCCEACGNLKAAFLLAVVFLLFCTLVTIYFAKEVPLTVYQPMGVSDSVPLLEEHSKSLSDRPNSNNSNQSRALNGNDKNVKQSSPNVEEAQNGGFQDGPGAVLVNLLTSLRHLPPAMHSVLIVMALTWLSWFPFFLFDTDWMGREVFHGDPKGDLSEVHAYDQGVREGAFGLLLNSVVLGISSFLIEPMCKRMGSRLVWAMSNFIVFACMAGTAMISWISVGGHSKGTEHVIGGNESIKIASLIVFAILGFPLSITYSVPFSVTAELTADAGGGQGLAIGVLNLSIVIPQMIVSLGAGQWDALFGGGNIPAFVLASFAALAAGIFAVRRLPDLSNSFTSTGFHFG